MKLYWKVSSVPTGRYRSFEKRAWPSAYYDKDCQILAAYIACEDEYRPQNVKEGDHAPLIIRVADYSCQDRGFEWRKVKRLGDTLAEAKKIASDVLDKHPNFLPKEK